MPRDDCFKSLCRPAQEDAISAITSMMQQNPDMASRMAEMLTSVSVFVTNLPLALEVGILLHGVRLVINKSHETLDAAERLISNRIFPKFSVIGIVQLHGIAVQVGAVTVRDPRYDVTGRVIVLMRGNLVKGLALAFAPTVPDRMSLNHPLVRRALRRAAALPPAMCQIA